MWRNGLSLNKKPSDEVDKRERASGWGPLVPESWRRLAAQVAAKRRIAPRYALNDFGSTEERSMTLVRR
jgi:hypothetical protein